MITTAEIRNRLRIDDFKYNNEQIDALKEEAVATLTASVGSLASPATAADECDVLVNRYVVEYCRQGMTGADNGRILVALTCQIEALMRGSVG